MIEYGITIGYGIVIDNEVMHNIYNHIDMSYPKSEDYNRITETFRDLFTLEIDSWGGNEHFIGTYHNLDAEDAFVINLTDYKFKDEEIKELLDFIINHGIFPVIANIWKPELLLIHYYH